MTALPDLSRRTALQCLAVATVVGGVFRFYGLNWGAPYHHFHIDEHYIFAGADLLRRSAADAADSLKFFMYPPLPHRVLNVLRAVYEWFAHPLDLTVPKDEVTYMVMGRAISATLSTATIPVVYLIGARLGGRLAGVLAAVLLACSVLHLRDAHFLTTDSSLAFFSTLTWWYAFHLLDGAGVATNVKTGIAFGLAVLSKYTAVFLAPLIALAHLLSPQGPRQLFPLRAWMAPVFKAVGAGLVGLAVFLIIDPMIITHYARFRQDLQEQIFDPVLSGVGGGAQAPQFYAQFGDVNQRTFWFTNVLWWGMGPAWELWGLAGVVWLLLRRDRAAFLAGTFPIVFWLVASQSVAPFPRYAIPLMPALAVSAAVLSADWLRRSQLRLIALTATAAVLTTTALWAGAYLNVYRQPDSRLQASAWLLENVPRDSKILIEPSHGIPPMGSYLTSVDFFKNYVMFYPETERHDYYHLFPLDMYRSLWNRGVTDDWRREYIRGQLALADWIVMDDQFVQQYQHQPESEHGVVKQYYQDLFAGKLEFALVKTFKVYPSIFGWRINDDDAELTFRSFDHPKIYIFRRFRPS